MVNKLKYTKERKGEDADVLRKYMRGFIDT